MLFERLRDIFDSKQGIIRGAYVFLFWFVVCSIFSVFIVTLAVYPIAVVWGLFILAILSAIVVLWDLLK